MPKTVLITGASRGIGAGTAELFAQNGYIPIINYCSNSKCAEEIAEKTGGIAVKADVSDIAQTKKMVDMIIEKYKKIDVLINNAGISLVGMFDMVSQEQVKRLFDVNVFGTMNCTGFVLPHMIKRKYGRIINISSMWGETGASCEVHYSASKAAVIGFTKALAKETAPSGVTVNCISPGFIMTDMNRCFSDEEIEEIISEIPVRRGGYPEDIASAALFLASPQAGFITGQILGINGGMVV